MKLINPLDICAYYLHRGYTVQFVDTDYYRLEDAKALKVADPYAFRITDASRPGGTSYTHYDVCVAVNSEEFRDEHDDWLTYGTQSIEFHV